MAVNDPTTNYAWNIPNNLADDGAWGTILRIIFGEAATDATYAPQGGIDKILKAVSDVANAALARAGGTMTGALKVLTEHFTLVNLGSMTGTVNMDLAAADTFYGTVIANTTLTFTNVPTTGSAVFVTLELTNGGAATVTWPGNTKWPGGSPPTLTTSGVDVVTFYTRDGGVTWRAAVAMRNSA